jgi:hypothetical protein
LEVTQVRKQPQVSTEHSLSAPRRRDLIFGGIAAVAFGNARTKGFANPSQIFANIIKLIGPNAKIFGPGFIFNNKGLFIYDTAAPTFNHLVISLAPFAGADDGVGNAFLAGIELFGNTQILSLTTKDASEGAAGTLLAGTSGAGPTRQLVTELISPDLGGQNAAFELASQSADGTLAAKAVINRPLIGVGGVWALAGQPSGPPPAGAEPWNLMSGGYANNWLDGGRVPGRYRFLSSPPGEVELEGSLTVPVGFAVGQTIFTLPAGYRPLAGFTQSIIGRNVSGVGVGAAFSVNAAGQFQFQGSIAAATAAGDILDFHGSVSLD